MSMNPEAVASSHSILSQNFTLSRAFLTYSNSMPSPFKNVNSLGALTSDCTFVSKSMEINELEYLSIRWMMDGPNLRGESVEELTSGLGKQNKRILSIGIPLGLI